MDSQGLNEGPSDAHSLFETGSSSAPSDSSTPQLAHDAASERLARFFWLVKELILHPGAKECQLVQEALTKKTQ